MIGQKEVLEREFSQFTLLLGKEGSGKKTLVREKFDDVAGAFSKIDDVRWVQNDAKKLTSMRTYLFDGNKMTYPAQHAILKIAEEPNEYTRIVITGKNHRQFLRTIHTRATLVRMQEYTKEELLNFTNNEEMLKYFDTPGLLKKATPEYEEIADNIIDRLKGDWLAVIFILKDSFDDFQPVAKMLKYKLREYPDIVSLITEYENYYDRYDEKVLDELFLRMREELHANN